MHQSTTPSLSQTIWARWASTQFLSLLIVQTLLPVTFGYSLSSEAVVMRQLRRWKRLWRRSLTRSHKRRLMGPCRNCWNGTTSALQLEEITLGGKVWISLSLRWRLSKCKVLTLTKPKGKINKTKNDYIKKSLRNYITHIQKLQVFEPNFWAKINTFFTLKISKFSMTMNVQWKG